MTLTERQMKLVLWAIRNFGNSTTDMKERARRLLEEAVKLAQAVGVEEHQSVDIVRYVYQRPAGSIEQEIAGVTLTLEAAHACYTIQYGTGKDMDELAEAELDHILAVPMARLREKHQSKVRAGIAAGTCHNCNPEPKK
jgi:hypothetical protein